MQLSWEAIAGGVVSITMFAIAVSRRVAIKRAERQTQSYQHRASFQLAGPDGARRMLSR